MISGILRAIGAADVVISLGFGCIVVGIYIIYPPLALIVFGSGLLTAGIVLAKGGK